MAFIGCARNPHRSAPARLRNTDPEDLFLALTSFLPGDSASEEDLSALRAEIAKALEAEGGAQHGKAARPVHQCQEQLKQNVLLPITARQ